MRKTFTVSTHILLALVITAGFFAAVHGVYAQIFKSQAVGIQVGDGIKAATQPGDNLIYGVLGPSATGTLMLLQNGTGINKFKVDVSGNVVAAGDVNTPQLCVQGDCKSAWPALSESDTLQTVTDRNSTTTKSIVVASINTGSGAYEVYPMDQHMRTGDSVVFGYITATGGNSANWNTAYSQTLQWNGGSSGWSDGGAAGRSSLGLGSLAQLSSANYTYITPNIVSSIKGVSNDGGNIDFVGVGGISIAPDVVNKTIAISSSGGASGWTAAGGDVYLTAPADEVGIGNTSPSSPLHVGPESPLPSTPGAELTVSDSSILNIGDSAVAYIESSGSHSGARSATLNAVALGPLTGADASVLSLHAQSTLSSQGDMIRIESEDVDVNFLQAQNAAGTEVTTLKYDGGAYFAGNVGINTSGPNYNLEVNGTTKSNNLILGTYDPKPSCGPSDLATWVFDTAADRPYACTSSGWVPLGSDMDGDGFMNAIDPNDSYYYDTNAYTSDVAAGKNFYNYYTTRQTGTAAFARPGCGLGDAPASSGDQQYDYCDNDHDSQVDELDPVNTVTVSASGSNNILLDVPGQTCYYGFESRDNIYGSDGQFWIANTDYDAERYCKLHYGSSWGAYSHSSSGSASFGCYAWGDGVSWGIEQPAHYILLLYSVTCNDTADDIRN